MREDVLSLRALGGDPVSEEYLKAELYHRAEALKDIPDTPLFFGRLDYAGHSESGDDGVAGHSFHIGRRHVHAPDGTPAVIDWRAPVSRPFYRASATDPMNLARRRRFGFSGGGLIGVVEAAEEQWGVGDVFQGFGPVVQLRLEVLLGDRVAAHCPQRQDVLAHETEVLARAPQLVALFGQDGIAGPFGMLVILCL